MNTSHPRRFFDEMVLPSYRAWLAEPLTEWLAKCATGYADDLAERVFRYWERTDQSQIAGARKPSDYRTHLRMRVCQDFGLVWDIHDGQKHMSLDRKNRLITNASQTAVAQIGYGEGNYSEGMYGGADQIVIELDDGTKRSLLGVMQNVIEMWERLLTEMGL